MFYFFECIVRIKYFIFSFFLTLLILFFYRELFLFIFFIIPLLKKKNEVFFFNLDDLIYTHPIELLQISFLLVFFLSLIFILPYIFWQICDFFKQSFYYNEYYSFIFFFYSLLFFLYSLNFFGFFYLFPKVWIILHSFSATTFYFDVSFELKIDEYIYFIINSNILMNLIILICFILLNFLIVIGVANFIYWKKLFLFFNLVCATLFSPPDVYSQLFLFIFFTVFFEFYMVFSLFFIKNKKYLS